MRNLFIMLAVTGGDVKSKRPNYYWFKAWVHFGWSECYRSFSTPWSPILSG